jgi:hypothetical protein
MENESNKEVTKQPRAQELAEAFMQLPLEERRSRLLVLPYYSMKRDQILEPDNVVQQFRYFWDKWVPFLGPVASMLYMKLRQYCYYNRLTGEVRDYCFPKQSTLGDEIGVKDNKTIRKALVLLEEQGLIRREVQYRYDQRTMKKVRTTDIYHVAITDILTPEDSVAILLDESKSIERKEDRPVGKISPQVMPRRLPPVDNSGPKGKNSPHISAGNNPQQEEVLIRNTLNVDNVRVQESDSSLRTHPTVLAMPTDEKARKENLALEIGDQLHGMAGSRGFDEHKSAGFHRRVAYLFPEHLVREALIATRDAVDDERSGRKSLRSGPAAYFAGIVRQIAERERIDIGVQWKAKATVEGR